jgi:hypothetical protein
LSIVNDAAKDAVAAAQPAIEQAEQHLDSVTVPMLVTSLKQALSELLEENKITITVDKR